MPNRAKGGIHPIDRHPSTELMFDVDSSNGTAIFIGDLVKVVAAGTVNLAAAGDASIVAGSVVGIYDSNGVPVSHPNSSVSQNYLPASTAGKVMVALALPGRRFRASCATALTSAARMASTDHIAGTGNTTVGASAHKLNGADLNTGAQFLILDLYPEPNNSYGADQEFIVCFNESIFMGIGKSAGV